MLIDHVPQGNPCELCGESAFSHRSEHKPHGDPCALCGLSAARHRVRSRKQASKEVWRFIGVDGEGQGRVKHNYVLLGAATDDGKLSWYVEDHAGLSTERCLDFLLQLPQHNTKTFAYSFGYDLTKILTEVDDDKLYMLARPELRQRLGAEAIKGPRPIYWRGYMLNLQGTKFTIAKEGRYRVVWDVWKFFQGKFVSALTDWQVGSDLMRKKMSHMKDKRADFDKESPEDVRAYCLEECRYMAELARKLVNAHEAAGLKLRSFYGAGSTAASMLQKMGIRDKIRLHPKNMNTAVASAFFGGRFENSVIGAIEGPVFNYDISSAYPYHLCFLPCLVHGAWERTTRRADIDNAHAALVHYALPPPPGRDVYFDPEHETFRSFRKDEVNLGLLSSNGVINKREWQERLYDSWAPFPFRTDTGSICFPLCSGGGWVWRDEFLAGEKLYPHTQFLEAWVYVKKCDCKPFDQIPKYYLERLRIGKEGPGIVIKLGMNSNYGKLAQSVGKGIFNSWVWAGMITSNTRAQILTMIGLHKDPRNLLMIATDGIQTREELDCPKPKDTNTDIAVIEEKSGKIQRKPLGGWEKKRIDKGVFYARPGIYFPLNPTEEEIKEVRGRGVGKGVVLENHKKIMDSWLKHGIHETAQLANVSRFCGFKSSISRSGAPGKWVYKRADGTQETLAGREAPAYGQWIVRPVEMSFHPKPKRLGINPDGVTLELRAFSQDFSSIPYNNAIRSLEATQLAIATMEALEQPDGDLTDYEPAEH